MRQSKSSRSMQGMDLLFSLLLLFVFILCSVFTILIGSRVYENIRTNDNASFFSDTAVSYVANKVRQADRADYVNVRSIDGCSVLVLTSSSNGILRETWVYTHDGVLKELYSEKDSGLSVEDGLDIMECPPLSFTLNESNKQLTICLEAEPTDITARILLRSNRKGGQES